MSFLCVALHSLLALFLCTALLALLLTTDRVDIVDISFALFSNRFVVTVCLHCFAVPTGCLCCSYTTQN